MPIKKWGRTVLLTESAVPGLAGDYGLSWGSPEASGMTMPDWTSVKNFYLCGWTATVQVEIFLLGIDKRTVSM